VGNSSDRRWLFVFGVGLASVVLRAAAESHVSKSQACSW
jgi:hypothetical protein